MGPHESIITSREKVDREMGQQASKHTQARVGGREGGRIGGKEGKRRKE